jgi:nucleotide-binding universal stress UspA family protein
VERVDPGHGTIVCGVGDSAHGRAAAQLAAAISARVGLRLVLVHVVEDRPRSRRDAVERRVSRMHGALEVIAREIGDAETRVVLGNRVDGLAQVAADEGADAIVLGCRPRRAPGRGLRSPLAQELEAAQAVPVLIAPPATHARSGRRLALADAASER